MQILDRTVGVMISKKIQEQEYEPYTIQLLDTVLVKDCNNKDAKKLRKKMYHSLERELDNLIDQRIDSLEE